MKQNAACFGSTVECHDQQVELDLFQEFDGGDKACGPLITELASFFKRLASGERVCVIAYDPGAWIDIPAWCRLVGHGFIDEAPPYYLLERR